MKDVIFFLHRVYPDNTKKPDDICLTNFIKALKLIKRSFKIVPLQAIFEEESRIRRAAITFDDGYTDNFVYAYPILKKMKIPAHIFLSSGRIRNNGIQKNLLDYWNGKTALSELYKPISMSYAHKDFIIHGESKEFLSWEEIEKMKDIFTFGAHSVNHFTYPYSSKIEDFFSGENPPWYLYIYHTPPFIGQPIFPTRSAMDTKRFFPSKELLNFCKNFPKKNNWKTLLHMEIEKGKVPIGKFESYGEAIKRIKKEMITSKKIIENKLGVEVNSFAWPFGHYSNFSKQIAASIFKYIFTIKKGLITKNSDLSELPRISIGKDLFTVLGRLLTFSNDLGFRIYKFFKRGKVL